MSKSAKKTPATASWRTLMRRADATTNKAEATKLREQAASLRRDERKAAKKPKRKTVPEPDQGAQIRQEWFNGITEFNRVNAAADRAATAMEAPGRGEIVGGEVAKLADTLAALARKKGGTDAVQAELARMIATARYEGQKAAEEAASNERIAIHESQRVKVVASFMAQIDAMSKANGGPIPKVVPVSGFVLAHLMNTLIKAGYSIEGHNQARPQ